MATLDTALDPRAPSFLENRGTALAALSLLEDAHGQAVAGGGEREVTRHHARGKLLPRERIELLVDRDTALLELAATAGVEVGDTPGAGVVTAIGVVERVECMIVGNDPTVRESGLSQPGLRKVARAVELARLHELPLIFMWESSADVPFAAGVAPVVGAIFGSVSGPVSLADYCIALRGHGDETGADAIAEDERDAIRIVRQTLRRLTTWRAPRLTGAPEPRHETDDLLAITRTDLREILARLLDGSDFEETRPHRGGAIVAGFGSVHGSRVAIVGNTAAELSAEAVHKALELRRLATVAGLPVLVLANPAQPSGELARALADPRQITLLLAAEPPEWALVSSGFRFTWPSSATANQPHDAMIDPRDTRTVLGICLSVLGVKGGRM